MYLAHEKMASKTIIDLEFDGIGRRYEDFVHQESRICSSINGFRERIRVITNASFTVDRLN